MATQDDVLPEDHWFVNEDRTLEFYITDEAGNPLDVSGYRLRYALKRNKRDEVAIIEKTTDTPSEVVVVDGRATGDLVQVFVADSDTTDLQGGWYDHVLRRDDDGSEYTLSFGRAYIGRTAA